MASYSEWRIAYAKQAKADLLARDKLLAHPDIPECQQLHFLQMACEKICKAYLCGQSVDPGTLAKSHAYIARTLPNVARQQFALQHNQTPTDHSWMIRAIRKLAREIELLAPAVKGGGAHPANCEYPWVGTDGSVNVPMEHKFHLDLLYETAGRQLIKALYTAADDLIRTESVA